MRILNGEIGQLLAALHGDIEKAEKFQQRLSKDDNTIFEGMGSVPQSDEGLIRGLLKEKKG